MKNYLLVLVLICFGLVISNCNLKENQKIYKTEDIRFLDITLQATIDTFIDKTNIQPTYKYDEILIKLYQNDKTLDTLMLIDNSPVNEKINFLFSSHYKGYKVYFYSPKKFQDEIYKRIDTSNINKEIPKKSLQNIDISYQMIYRLTKDTIVKHQIPIEID
jgi:hypothetical protein